MGWSVLSPLMQLLVMSLVFTQFFAHNQPHYTIYLFCGNLVFNYYKEVHIHRHAVADGQPGHYFQGQCAKVYVPFVQKRLLADSTSD